MQERLGPFFPWQKALQQAQWASFAGHSDWRLPNPQTRLLFTRCNFDPMFSSRIPSQLSANRLTRLLAARRSGGAEILDLTESNPTAAGFRYDEGRLAAALNQPGLSCYSPSPHGAAAARAAIAEYYLDHGRQVVPEDIFLTASTSEAYCYLFKLLGDPGAEILVPQPSYPLFEGLIKLEALRPVAYPLRYKLGQGWRFDLEFVRNLISTKTRAIVAVNPNNPTGSFIRAEELSGLNEICADFGLALIIDEVFLDYPRRKIRPSPPLCSAAGNQGALTFVLSGLSKIVGLPQLKLGWVLASGPEPLLSQARERLEFIADMYLSVGSAVQLAAPELLAQRAGFCARVRRRLAENERRLTRAIAGRADLRMLAREGGWYAILQLTGISVDDEDLVCGLLEQTGVLVHPGYFYEFRRDGFLVVSLLTRPAIFREGVTRLLDYLGPGAISGAAPAEQ